MRKVSWVSESGYTVVFEGAGPYDSPGPYYFRELTSDLGATAETTRAPRQDGVTTWHVALDSRTVNLVGSMWVFGDRLHPAAAEYDRQRAFLAAAFAPNRWGVLTYYREDGAVQVRCRAAATPTFGPAVGTFATIDITLAADSPYWESAEETVEVVGVIRKLWHFPWHPVREPMGVYNPFAVTPNPTDVDIYPTIEVYSTGQYVTVENTDLGEFVTIEHPIAEGQKLVIDMSDVSAFLWERDGQGVYHRREDVSHWMSLDSTPWCLKPGGNHLAIRNDKPEDTPVAYIRYRVPSLGV